MNVLVTGITGFIGRNLFHKLSERGDTILGVIRTSPGRSTMNLKPDALATESEGSSAIQLLPVANIDGETNWVNALKGINTIIHLAARVHIMTDLEADPIATYRQTNVDGTINLAREAAAQGVKRFIYVSSIKVNGEERPEAYTEKDLPAPQDPYGISKWEAEQALTKLAAETGLEVVIIRPPLVYGPGVKANFLRLLNLVARKIPLPFGSLKNKRSMIFVGNLVSAIITCCDHPAATGHIFLVSDNEDVSICELLQKIAVILKLRLCLFPFPPFFLNMAASCLGKSAEARRLTKPLRLNCQKICTTLSWFPPYSLDKGLTETVKWLKKD